MSGASLLVEVLRHPSRVASLDPGGWDLLVRQARRAELLAHLYAVLDEEGLRASIPPAPLAHLESAGRLARAQQRVVRWEARCIYRALAPLKIPVVFLKGAAYLLAGLPNSRGRLFNDVDILVPRERLEDVERALMRHGWMSTHLDAYDQRYYRTWMHELPPLRHIRRHTVLDVHHNILPDTARLHPDPRKLLDSAREAECGFLVLAPEDMVLHSATHLFHDGELEQGLRDLVDLDILLRRFGKDEGFWHKLLERAAGLELGRPLYYALCHAARCLNTPVPESALESASAAGPSRLLSPFMRALFERALEVNHASCRRPGDGLARWLLYVRGHYLRMPLHLLLPHLARKAWRRVD